MPNSHQQLSALAFEDAVQVALDTDEMLERFEQHFSQYMPAQSFQDCRLSRVRIRDGQRAVFQYEISVRSHAALENRNLAATGTIYAQKQASHIVRKLLKEKLSHTEALEVATSMPRLNMLVQVFPQDRRLPHLASVFHGLPSPMVRLLSSHFGVARNRVEQCEITAVRYRAGLSAVLRIDLPLGECDDSKVPGGTAFVKLYPGSGEAEKAFEQFVELTRTCATAGVACANPIGIVKPHAAVLLAGAMGPTLEEILTSHYKGNAVRAVAGAIARLNTANIRLRRIHNRHQQTQCLQRAVRKLGIVCPELSSTLKRIASKISVYPDVVLAPTHRDIKPEHLFFEEQGITFIDCDSMAMSDPVIDPAMFLARLAALAIHGILADAVTEQASDEFVNEYFCHVPFAWRQRLNLHYAGALLEIAVGFFGRQEAGWRHVIHRLVDESKRTLERPRFL